MDYKRMPIEAESPEEFGYHNIECNLAESSVKDALFGSFKDFDLSKLVLSYGDHRGHPELRKAIAEEACVNVNDILLVPGAAAGLFIIATSLLNKGDELVVVHPNYSTNLATPEAIGAKVKRLNVLFENGFKIETEKLKKLITRDTGYVSITTPHNPTGVMIDEQELRGIIDLVCVDKNRNLLIDETYRYMSFKPAVPVGAGINNKVISVSSVSKAFGLPGIRIGWIITQDKDLMERFLAAKEQILIANSVIDEEIAWIGYKRRNEILSSIKKHVNENFDVVSNWLDGHDVLEWVKPEGGVVCFPRFKNPGEHDIDKFYDLLKNEYKTWVGPGHWFDMPDSYFRIGFGWPDKEELEIALKRIDEAIGRSRFSVG
jgi:aspartate/methionine/tyrosine aminotransferase